MATGKPCATVGNTGPALRGLGRGACPSGKLMYKAGLTWV